MNVVVIGAQWGDEGKGKIVDFLADEASVVTRYSGGANAGHTIVHNDITYKLHLVPSGILYPNTQCLIGAGVVLDPKDFIGELDEMEKRGIVSAKDGAKPRMCLITREEFERMKENNELDD